MPSSGPSSNLTRHVSQASEPTFSQSIRRTEEKALRSPVQSVRAADDEFDFIKAPKGVDFVSAYMLQECRPLMLTSLQANGGEPAMTDREAMETELIRALISSYFNIVRESIADQVPKAIMHLLVNHCKDVVQNRLVSELYKETLFEELLYEDDAVKKEREKCEKLLQTYREAAKIIGEVI
jgi:dynamin 1-like protein